MRKLPAALAFLVLTLIAACTELADTPTMPQDPSVSLDPMASLDQLARSAQEQGFIPGRVLVRFRSGAPIEALVRAQGGRVDRQLARGTRVLAVPTGRERNVANALRGNPNVEFAEPDYLYTVDEPCGTGLCNTPNDGFFGYRWDLHNDGWITDDQGSDVAPTGAEDADTDWLETFDAMVPLPGTAVIGIIDTGIRSTHEDLAGKLSAGFDFFDMDPDPADDHGHGTHVAGIAAAHGNNGTGVPGVAWVPEVRLAAAKVCGYIFPGFHGCPSSAIADGIAWATDNGADVLNISLGGGAGSSEVQSALQYARQNGVLPFCAAGNDAGVVSFPGAFPECVAVSATNWSDGLASYSNFGPEIELAAPGGDFEDSNNYSFILSASHSSDVGYAWLAGTSMASPQAAGLGGLLHALGVTGDEEKLTRMRATANDLGDPGEDVHFGAGRINVYAAVADLIGAPTNQSPIASFTRICDELTCDFTDTSKDSEGTVVFWFWNFGDGATSTARNPSHTYAGEGTYTVTLTATDNEGASDAYSMNVTVPLPNQPPTASFAWICTGLTCDFTDTSTDADGAVMSWSWELGDGNTSTEQNPSHTYANVGSYVVRLIATDDDSDADTFTTSVTVAGPNDAPTASFSYSCVGLSCAFTDTSTDGDGSIVVWDWSFGDGWSSNGRSPNHVYGATGTYAVSLTVYDDDGASSTFNADVTIAAPGEAPTASFTTICTELACDFTDGSTAGIGSLVSWSWDMGDGNTSTAQNPSHEFAVAGTYTVTLTVNDDRGVGDTFSKDVMVPADNQAPTASFTTNCTGLTCDFTDTSADGDGTVVSWLWDFGDGNTSTVQNPSHPYGSGGTYTVALTATDDDGATNMFGAAVTVAEPNQAPTASFTLNCRGLACAFTNTSTDEDGSIVAWDWSFGDGWSSNGQSPNHTYVAAGTFTVSLTADLYRFIWKTMPIHSNHHLQPKIQG